MSMIIVLTCHSRFVLYTGDNLNIYFKETSNNEKLFANQRYHSQL